MKKLELESTKEKSHPESHTAAPKSKKLARLPKISSSLTEAFSALDGGWTNYIRFAEVAAKEGDEQMRKLMDTYVNTPKAERLRLTPEDLCRKSGVSIKDLFSAVLAWVWIYSNLHGSMLAAAANPAVIARTARAALGIGKNSHRDRETFLKVTGALPTARGSQTTINNNAVATAQSAAMLAGGRLSSAGQDILALESSEYEDAEKLDEDNQNDPDKDIFV